MNTYAKVYITALFCYSLVVEAAIWVGTHHLKIDPFLALNGQLILVGGGVVLFVTGLFGLMEGFWD